MSSARQKAFITLFDALLRLCNTLASFDEFAGHEIINPPEFQDCQSIYLDLYAELRTANQAGKESINDDVVFEIELIQQVEVNVDYISPLSRDSVKPEAAATGWGSTRSMRSIDSSRSLRNKKDLIMAFVDSV